MQVIGQSRSRLMRKFAALGPYIREHQCQEQQFFFDCLAVCANPRLPTEKREFWGWWMVLDATESGFEYHYQVGFYDNQGDWLPKHPTDDAITEEIQRTLQLFYPRLVDCLQLLNISLQPAAAIAGRELSTAA
ncbi:MAG: sigma factor-binding protein Crl [Plesiomonas sp.]|uniref:sigma factor-binding protein Crl n=1 Tax=Plesiomonas sp. TaxID=2486279 RepID=UPI003EE49D5E